MNRSATTILVSNQNNRLDRFRRFLIFGFVFLILAASCFFIFEGAITDYLMAIFPRDRGLPYYQDLFRLAARELIWTAGIFFIALLIHGNSVVASTVSGFEKMFAERTLMHWIFGFLGALILFIGYVSLNQFPNSSDEYVYLFQGETLSHGQFWEKSHSIPRPFEFNHIAHHDGITVGRFPPGWPLLLSLFLWLSIPAFLVNPILSVLTLAVFHRFAEKKYGAIVAGWSTLILGFSSFFVFNSASYFSHASCLLAIVLFVDLYYKHKQSNKFHHVFLAGFCLGFVAITRYYTAALIFIPFGISLLREKGLKSFGTFFLIGLGSFPFILFCLWYNYAITGNALTPVTIWAYQGEGLGFVKGHTALKGLEHIIRRFFMFSLWCSPVILFLYFFLPIRNLFKGRTLALVSEDYFFLLLMCGYFLYYEIGGNQYGPRFYYEALPFMIVYVVRNIYINKNYNLRVLLYASLFVMICKIPFLAHRERAVVRERTDVYTLVEQNHISHAVVILGSGTGVIRPMPSGDLTRNDRAFRNDVLYALDRPDSYVALRAFYKDRKFYRYIRRKDEPVGRLEAIE